MERSQSLFGAKAAVISQLWALVNECDEAGWDGSDAEPIDERAALAAANFIRALPDGLPLPEVAADPDGAVSLDWIPSRNRQFSVSVGTSNGLAYAWLDGSDQGRGVAWFDGEQVSQWALDGICEIGRDRTTVVG